MSSPEGEPSADILALYRGVDPTVLVGEIPLADCLEMQAAAGDPAEMSPGARYDFAWLSLETSLAMAKTKTDPTTGQPYKPKDINGAIERTRTLFRGIARDDNAPTALRLRARLAEGSILSQHEARTHGAAVTISKRFDSYTRSNHTAAREVLAIEDPSPEETALAHQITTLAIGTEYSVQTAYFFLASPRQPWDINTINRRNGQRYGLVIGEEAPDGVIAISPSLFHIDALNMLRHGGGEFSALNIYANVQPGLGARSSKSLESIGLELAATLLYNRMAEQTNVIDIARVAEVAGAVAVQVEQAGSEEEERSEVAWYKSQPAGDIRDVPETSLQAQISNLEFAAGKAELGPTSFHALAWMHIDYAQILLMRSQEAGRQADASRLQASRVSRLEAPAHEQAAEAHDVQAEELWLQARAQFDAAETPLQASYAGLTDERAGERCEVALDIAALPVYRALFTPQTDQELPAATETYLRRLAALAPTVRDTARRFTGDDKQRNSTLGAGIRALMTLMLTGANDEAVRHLVLPASIRGGGTRGEAHAVVFPLEVDGYNPSLPVTVNIVGGKDIVVQRQHLEVGMRALAPGGADDIPSTLNRIAGVVRTYGKGRGAKRKSHGAAVDATALTLSDAVADATE